MPTGGRRVGSGTVACSPPQVLAQHSGLPPPAGNPCRSFLSPLPLSWSWGRATGLCGLPLWLLRDLRPLLLCVPYLSWVPRSGCGRYADATQGSARRRSRPPAVFAQSTGSGHRGRAGGQGGQDSAAGAPSSVLAAPVPLPPGVGGLLGSRWRPQRGTGRLRTPDRRAQMAPASVPPLTSPNPPAQLHLRPCPSPSGRPGRRAHLLPGRVGGCGNRWGRCCSGSRRHHGTRCTSPPDTPVSGLERLPLSPAGGLRCAPGPGPAPAPGACRAGRAQHSCRPSF